MLQNIRTKVAEQLAKSRNYTCLQTVDRSYFQSTFRTRSACDARAANDQNEIMHDRLRLNVAVSDSGEIYSWQGERKFSSAPIDKIVQGGPISSGSFVGFLSNIFITPGIEFTFRGSMKKGNVGTVQFDYKVQKAFSHFRVQDGEGLSAIVPFHGSFAANADSFELIQLKIIADQIPPGLSICATDNEVQYQMAEISGSPTLIARTFELRINSEQHLDTISRSTYSQCHEFQAASTIHFDTPGDLTQAPAEPVQEQRLPAGLDLPLVLTSTIDSKTAYTGDPVEAVTTAAIRDSQGKTLIPQSAVLHGVITQLERFYRPQDYYALRLQFRWASFGGKTYLLRASHKPTGKEKKVLIAIYEAFITEDEMNQIEQGTIYFRSGHLRLDSRFRGEWQTTEPPSAEDNAGH